MMHESSLETLKEMLADVMDLRRAASVLSWDQLTYMPQGGAAARAQQIATLRRLAHERFTSAELGQLLDRLEPLAQALPYESDDASLIRVTRRDFERNNRIPADFLAELSEHTSASYQTWAQARPENDVARVLPRLERTLELSLRYASFFPEAAHPADPLIDSSDQGMTVALLRPLFADLRAALVPMVEAITAQTPPADAALEQAYPEQAQLAFGLDMAERFGYDLSRGRQDKTAHPFATSFSVDDVRITTRVKAHDLREALFSTLHEAGHAMYEQGVSPSLEPTPLAKGTSSGVHESQSRLWENLVGRSQGFWTYAYPKLQAQFPEQLGHLAQEDFYRAINRVSRSLIRTDADELSYNLHVMIRFELELALLEGRLAVRDLAEAWQDAYERDLGIRPGDHKDGVLQDVHWFAGLIGGAFQGYSLGNILSAQFFDAAEAAHPDIPKDIARGKFETLHGWLRENIYIHGRKFTPLELIERATGQALTLEPYIAYLQAKYGALYDL